ncbi:MAG: CubicO group peptidase (beta-lactamase class C family) [Paraglaciecola sp.]|jgi:CubicO group peptidase (beta-lactamase class C family)
MRKKLLIGLGVVLLIAAAALAYYYPTIKRLQTVIHLFDEDKIVYNFQNIEKIFDVSTLQASPKHLTFPKQIDYQQIETFQYKDSTYNLNKYLEETKHEGFLILHKDTVIFEQYANGLTPITTHISWSMSKSVLATMIGIAHDKGFFQLNEPVTKYLPQFVGTGYDGIPIKHLLQMSSGVGFNEDYTEYDSDINRFGRMFATGGSFEEFAKTLNNERPSGTYCHYVSMDTQVLGILLAKITGQSLTEYAQQNLWNPIGMQDEAQWVVDNTNSEMALGGLNMTMRDYAKLGQLYLHEGNLNGHQIVSANWIKAATTPDAPHLQPGDNSLSSNNYGYGFQWWIPEKDEGDFFAAGIYNQHIYVQPKKDLVIVKLTANHHFKTQGPVTKDVHIAMLKTMAAQFSDKEIAATEPILE